MKKNENMVQFNMRLPEDLARKMSYIGDYYGRSRNSEIIWALQRYVAAYENKNGPIDLEE